MPTLKIRKTERILTQRNAEGKNEKVITDETEGNRIKNTEG
jgi:hypothetical protein